MVSDNLNSLHRLNLLSGLGVGFGVGLGVGFGVDIKAWGITHLCRPEPSSVIHRSTLSPDVVVLKYFRFPLTPPLIMMLKYPDFLIIFHLCLPLASSLS
jgi:hypothetical protein